MPLAPFRLIIAGSRDFEDYDLLVKVMKAVRLKTADRYYLEVVTGMARGADKLGLRYAQEHSLPWHEFPANWANGRGSGYVRNLEMAKFSDGLLAFWDGVSPGTRHMISCMKQLHKPVHVVQYL